MTRAAAVSRWSARRAGHVSEFKVASVLLQYPDEALYRDLDSIDAAVHRCPRGGREPLEELVTWLRTTGQAQAARHYVETFDLRRRCALYLTYYRLGDTRNRGMAMLAFKTAYRTAGLDPSADELPDYLPMVLEFAAMSPRGLDLLRARRADVELLRTRLHEAGTPYAGVLDAVCARLPGLGRRDASLVRRHLHAEPPQEDVGLEPFAPPEYLTGYGAPS